MLGKTTLPAVVAGLLLIAASQGLAQVTSASVFGTVSDKSGAVIPGATIAATNVETNFSRNAVSDELGQYSIKFLPLGSYRLEISAPSFKKLVQTGIVLELNRNARVDAVLEVGALTESVSVTSDAPLVNTSEASLGRTVDNIEINNLPLVNRDVYALLNLTAGVDLTETTNAFGYPGQRALIHGASDGGTGGVNYFLDGGNNMAALRNTGNTTPNPDAIQEFRVITNAYGAEFGRFAAGVVDVVTKSGTNALHGSLFEFVRNDKLNARPWNATRKDILRRNQFGGTAGGPLIKDRTFYFGSYGGLRRRGVDSKNSAIVPTALERQGDFSASSVKPNDPLTSQPFPGGLIPATRVDPVARRIIDQNIPLSNFPGSRYEAIMPHPFDSNELQLKIDHALSSAHQLTGSYFRNVGKEVERLRGDLPWSSREFTFAQHNLNVGETWTAGPATVNQLRLTYVRNFGGRLNLPAKSLGDLGSKFQIQGPPSLPRISVTGFFSLQQAIAGPVAGSNYYGIRDVLSTTRGRHTLKLGGDFYLDKTIQDTLLDNYGIFNFDGTKTRPSTPRIAIADFLLGLPRTMNQDAPVTKTDNAWYWAFFVQDDFRIHPRLTLNLGLRYDLQLPMLDPLDRKMTFIAARQSKVVPTAPRGLLFPGDEGVGRGVVPFDKNNFGPRIGVAWDPLGDGKTSIRSGFGAFYGSISGNEWNGSADRQPFAIRQSFPNPGTLSDPYRTLAGGIPPFPYVYTPANPRFIPPASAGPTSLDFRWPYTFQANFSVQRQVSTDLSVTAAYVTALGRKLPFKPDVNYPIYTPGATSATVDLRRPHLPGTLSSIGLLQSMINSAYHGMELTAEKRMSRGLSFRGFYTFSKGIDSADLQNGSTNDAAQNQRNLRPERGRTGSDRRHNLALSSVWMPNYFKSAPVMLRAILNDWSLSSIVRFRSGEAFTVSSGVDNNQDGSNNDRANYVGGDPRLDPNRPRSETTRRWFNAAAFAPNAAGQDGNAGRNILDGPGFRNVDLAVFRDFPVRESIRLQFRWELTNAFNMVNLANPTSNLSSRDVGVITSGRAMR